MPALRLAACCALFSPFTALAQIGIGTTSPAARLDIRHTSTTANPTLSLYDNGATNFARLQFQNASGGKFWNVAGLLHNTDSLARLNFYHSNYGDVMSLTGAGRVGVGTSAPAQKLDVAGNMQISGAIMPGGDPGAAGQFLRSSGGGAMSWAAPGFQNQVVFAVPAFPGSALNTTWTVPAGVTKIRVEMWSGGGHGGWTSAYDSSSAPGGGTTWVYYNKGGGGGGGGAYCSALLTVSPAQVLAIQVPTGGEGGVASVISGASAIYLNNGFNGNSTSGSRSRGGVFGGSTGAYTNVMWLAGGEGAYSKYTQDAFTVIGGTNYTHSTRDYGNGGSAPTSNNGGAGGYRSFGNFNAGIWEGVLRNGSNGGFPGGGGGGGTTTLTYGDALRGLGAGGMIVIHY